MFAKQGPRNLSKNIQLNWKKFEEFEADWQFDKLTFKIGWEYKLLEMIDWSMDSIKHL